MRRAGSGETEGVNKLDAVLCRSDSVAYAAYGDHRITHNGRPSIYPFTSIIIIIVTCVRCALYDFAGTNTDAEQTAPVN